MGDRYRWEIPKWDMIHLGSNHLTILGTPNHQIKNVDAISLACPDIAKIPNRQSTLCDRLPANNIIITP
jgi:hypothetical protein